MKQTIGSTRGWSKLPSQAFSDIYFVANRCHPLARKIVSGRFVYQAQQYSVLTTCRHNSLSTRKDNASVNMTTTATTLTGQPLDRGVLDTLLRRRMFYTPAFDLYGGVAGLFDYGPPGCGLQANIIDVWRKHFVLEEDMLEVDCTALTPYDVFKTSGHIDKFSDWMCKDPKSGEMLRADHFVEDCLQSRLKGDKLARGQAVEEGDKDAKRKKKQAKDQAAVRLEDAVVKEYEEILAKIDNYNGEELGELIKRFGLINHATGVQPEPPVAFNLMFQTTIGPSGLLPGYLRPETAQGQFLNFAKLLDYNQNSMPFASASIGRSYRNEISPRSGLLRVREFLMAEIEHFVDPESGKKHPRFHEVEDIEVVLLQRCTQSAGSSEVTKMAIGKAVKDKIIDNETLGYFIGRIHLFFKKIGADPTKIRFRQHMENEMAHYACDCWDAELLTSYGWIECVGCADRSAYDLSVHSKKTGVPLVVRQKRPEPLAIEEWQVDINKKSFGLHFKKNGRAVESVLLETTQEQRESLAKELQDNGRFKLKVAGVNDGEVEISKDLVGIERRTRIENVREYTPNVIEPSFGIGRILYALLEHTYWVRAQDGGAGEARSVISLPATVAPTKVLIVPLSGHKSFEPFTRNLSLKLRKSGISCKVDDSSATIGKRYSRNDELGTPLGITIDFQTVKDETITLRDRDSTRQVRASQDKIIEVIRALVEGDKVWADVEKELPLFEGQELDTTSETK